MIEGWEIKKLRNIASVQTGPFGSQLHKKDYVVKGTPIITVEHLGDNRITTQNLPQVSKEDKQRLAKFLLEENDVVFSRVGSVDRRALVTEAENGWMFSGRCLRVRADRLISFGPFLSYFFGQRSFKNYIRQIAVGATMPSINTSILSNIEITLPPLPEQKAIASILSAIDDKIELNLQMNKTLEEMAMTLYKHWFVDFGPFKDGKFVESELGMIPEGWEVKRLEELCKVNSSKRIFLKEYVESGIPFYRGKEVIKLSQGINIQDPLYISKERYKEIKEKYGVPIKGDILVTSVGTIGNIWRVSNERPFYFKDGNLTMISVFSSLELNVLIYNWIKSKQAQDQIKFQTIGSTQKALTISNLKQLKILLPNNLNTDFKSVLNHLDKIQSKIDYMTAEKNILQNLRDTLLPKLISGKVRLKEFEKQVSEVL